MIMAGFGLAIIILGSILGIQHGWAASAMGLALARGKRL